MRYNEVIIQSKSLGGCEILGILNLIPQNSKGAILFSHNSHGDLNEPVLAALETGANKLGYSTLRYNYHYVDRMPVENAKFEDVFLDLDAAYTTLLNHALAKNVFLVGKSLGSVVSLKYLSDNNLRCPLFVLGYFAPLAKVYANDAILRSLQAPVTVLQGEKDQYTKAEEVRVVLGQNRVGYELFEIANALHGFASSDEGVRTSSEISAELVNKFTTFLAKYS